MPSTNPYGFTTACTEEDGSPLEVVTTKSYKATVTLICAWADRYNLATEQADYLLYPRQPYTLARVKSISITPFTRSLGADPTWYCNDYEQAKIVTEYSFDAETPQKNGADLWSESLEPTAEMQTLPPVNLYWASGKQLSTDGSPYPTKLLPGFDYVMTHYNLASIPAAVLGIEPGSCNNADFTSYTLGLTFPTQTLMFNPAHTERRVNMGSSTSLNWNVTYRFTYRKNGWNKYWNNTSQAWKNIYTDKAATQQLVLHPPVAFTGF